MGKPYPDINWVEAGAVTSVKDQGYCGACWAFSTIAALEGAYFVKTGELKSFSEQQLIDCDHKVHKGRYYGHYKNKGCDGGYMKYAFYYFKHHFAMLDTEYPYTSAPKDAPETECKYSKTGAIKAKVKHVYEPNEKCRAVRALQKQPVVTAIAANNKYIHSYKSGVIDAADCDTTVMIKD